MTSSRWQKLAETIQAKNLDSSPSPTESTRKRSRREQLKDQPASTKVDTLGQPTYQGTMADPKMSDAQKRALTAFVHQASQESNEVVIPSLFKGQKLPIGTERVLPPKDVKNDHLLIKSIQLKKSIPEGRWILGEIETNKGTFEMGSEQNARLNQKMLQSLALYLKETFEQDLKQYIEEPNDV